MLARWFELFTPAEAVNGLLDKHRVQYFVIASGVLTVYSLLAVSAWLLFVQTSMVHFFILLMAFLTLNLFPLLLLKYTSSLKIALASLLFLHYVFSCVL